MRIYESLYIFSRYEHDIRYLMELIMDFGTYLDIVMLRKYLMMIYGIILAEFTMEVQNVNSFLNNFPVQKQQIDYSNVEKDLHSILSEINNLCEENSKLYRLTEKLFMVL